MRMVLFCLFVCFVVLLFIRKLKYGEWLVSLDDTAYYESLCQLKGMGARSLVGRRSAPKLCWKKVLKAANELDLILVTKY